MAALLDWASRNKFKAAGLVAGAGLAYATYHALTYQAPASLKCGQSFGSAVAEKMKILEEEERKNKDKPKPPPEKVLFTGAPRGPIIPVLILYGTEYGFSKEIAEKIHVDISQLERDGRKFYPRMCSMEDVDVLQIPNNEAILICTCSTQGDGVPPAASRPFFDYLEEIARPPLSLRLPALTFAVLALGDKCYPHFCRAGKQLDQMLEGLGASRLQNRRDVDLEDWGAINSWTNSLCSKLLTIPLPEVAPTSDYLWEKKSRGELLDIARPGTKKMPFYARIAEKRLLTTMRSKEDKETFHLSLALADSGLTYVEGDSLAVYPLNNPQTVDRCIALLKATGKEGVVKPMYHFIEPGNHGSLMPLRDALLKCYDLKNLKAELLDLLRAAKSSPSDHARLEELLRGGMSLKDNQPLAKYLKGRELDSVLEDFPSCKTTYASVLAQLKPLLPRFYSISSSQATTPTHVTITVAVVRYSAAGKERGGVASTHMFDRVQAGEQLPVYVNKNNDFRLPKDPSTPIIMIGPGTGLAPFRSFLQQRTATRASGANVLFFGCRSKNQDYLYKDELEAYAASGVLELHTAFSRDQAQKVYVQHRLAEQHARIWSLLQAGAHLYVCGDAEHMAGDVHKVLLKIAAEDGNQSDPAAFLLQLEHERRYQRDIWF